MSSPASSSSSSSNGGLNGLGPSLRRDVAGLSHRLSVLKAGLADLAASGCARAAASEACQGEVRTAQECLAEVKQVLSELEKRKKDDSEAAEDDPARLQELRDHLLRLG